MANAGTKQSPQRVTVTDTNGDGVSFTATVKDQPSFTVDVTEHAVEQGAPIEDHARRKLATLSMEALVSDLNDGEGAAQTALLFFVGLWNNPRPVEIVTPRIAYDAMVMTRMDPPRKKEDGRAVRFNLEFKEYRVVTTKKVIAQVKRGAPAPKGTQPAKVNVATDQRGLLKRLSDAGGGGITGVFTGAGQAIGSLFGGK